MRMALRGRPPRRVLGHGGKEGGMGSRRVDGEVEQVATSAPSGQGRALTLPLRIDCRIDLQLSLGGVAAFHCQLLLRELTTPPSSSVPRRSYPYITPVVMCLC
jgi:hypothetical protein